MRTANLRRFSRLRGRRLGAAQERWPGRAHGSSLIELLLALPLLLLISLFVLQAALLFQAHHALNYAVFEAARQASVNSGRGSAAEVGLASGMIAFLPAPAGLGTSLADRSLLQAAAMRHVRLGIAQQWIQLSRLSPTPAAFADWSEPARDDNGLRIAGPPVIPNDNLMHRRWSQQGSAGASANGGIAAIGASSGLTLSDANLLKLELRYGVRLIVPFVGPVLAWIMRQWDACDAGSTRLLGLLHLNGLNGPDGLQTGGAAWRCPFYSGLDEQGLARPRWPLRLSAVLRMQSPVLAE
jgi:TadE-like protein